MSWSKNVPTATESLATSQGTISGNFIAIEGALGSSTLVSGITKVAGDILYISDAETISKLAKVNASRILTNWSSSYNTPAWIAETGITKLGTITTGVWQGTAIAEGYVAASAIDQASLKTTTGAVSDASGGYAAKTLPGGTYGFYPQLKMSSTTSRGWNAHITSGSRNGWTTYATIIVIENGASSDTIYAQQRYVTASGIDDWLFLLIHKATKDIISGWIAKDHPCYGNGGNPDKMSHPHLDYNEKIHELVLIGNGSIDELKGESEKTKKDILELIDEGYRVDTDRLLKYKPLHSGQFINREPVMIERIPEFIKVRRLFKMTPSEKKERKRIREYRAKELENIKRIKEERIKLKFNLTDGDFRDLKDILK